FSRADKKWSTRFGDKARGVIKLAICFKDKKMNTDVQDFTSLVGRKSHKSTRPETKQFLALLSIKNVDLKNRRIEAIASTGSVDRDTEIIEPSAFEQSLPDYVAKNNVVLTGHQHRLDSGHSPVVANVVSAKLTPLGLVVVLEFHDITELAEEYWQLYSQKKQKALSVGFVPKKGGWETRDGNKIYVHTEVELIEISVVPVGSNRDALTKSKQRKADFVADKITQRQFEKREDEFAKILLTGDFKVVGIPDIEEDEFDLSGEADLEPEPDYVKIAKAN
ncbi:MAG: HK97 family phage prohead protease, partial [Sedimentisphaerales bacterium]